MNMDIKHTILCPNCGQKYEIGESFIDQVVQCKVCNKVFQIKREMVKPGNNSFNSSKAVDANTSISCPYCKKVNVPDASFCVSCGRRINGSNNGSFSEYSDKKLSESALNKVVFKLALVFGCFTVVLVLIIGWFLIYAKRNDSFNDNLGRKAWSADTSGKKDSIDQKSDRSFAVNRIRKEDISESPSEKYKKAILRVKTQAQTIFPENFSFDNMEDIDRFISVFNAIGSFSFDFTDCPSDYVGQFLELKRLSREMVSVLYEIKEVQQNLESNKDNLGAIVVLETMAYGSSPSYNSLLSKVEDLKKRAERLIHEIHDVTDIISSIENKYGISNS